MKDEKIFKKIKYEHQKNTKLIVKLLDVVADYIKKKKLIVYGGMAIDFALRLHGDSFYPKETLPDWDVYSPNSANDGYELTEIIYNIVKDDDISSVDCISATHITSVRVRVDFESIADICYVPLNIYNKLPTLTFDGIRFIDPAFQKIDTHRALSFPFYQPPLEAIFNRGGKVINQYNALCKYYNFENKHIISHNQSKNIKTKVYKKNLTECILTGFQAYALLFHSLIPYIKPKLLKNIIQCSVTENGDYIETEIKLFNTDEINLPISYYKEYDDKFISTLKNCKFYKAFLDMRPIYAYIGASKDDYSYEIFNMKNLLIPFSNLMNINVSNIQVIMLYMLQSYYEKDNDIYITFYNSLLELINIAEQNYKKIPQNILASFFPSTNILPNKGILNNIYPNLYMRLQKFDYLVLKTEQLKDIKKEEEKEEKEEKDINLVDNQDKIIFVPPPYYIKQQKERPIFEYNKSMYFWNDGTEIVNTDKQTRIDIVKMLNF